MAKKGNWRQRLDILERQVGHGDLVGGYSVDQRYAAKQHVERGYNHPRGGGPDFVSTPLRTRSPEWFADVADGLLAGHGPDRMADAMEDLDHQVGVLAPVDLNVLRQSGHPTVVDGFRPHYDRAPREPRLTDQQLRERRRAR